MPKVGSPTKVKPTITIKGVQLRPVAKGLFARSKQSGTLNYTLPKGACGTAGLSKVTFKNVTPIVFK